MKWFRGKVFGLVQALQLRQSGNTAQGKLLSRCSDAGGSPLMALEALGSPVLEESRAFKSTFFSSSSWCINNISSMQYLAEQNKFQSHGADLVDDHRVDDPDCAEALYLSGVWHGL